MSVTDQVAEASIDYLITKAGELGQGSVVPPGYKQTEVGVVPEDWEVKSIGYFNPFVTSGSRGWAEYYSAHGDPFVRITNLGRESIYLDMSDTKYVSLPEQSAEGKRTQLLDGDILVSITADIGIIGYVDEKLAKPAYINQHISLVRFFGDNVDKKYVAYFLASENIQKLFRGSSDQGAKAGMNLNSVRSISFAVPPQLEQTAIANALSDVDALINAQEKLISKKQAIKTATMQQLLTGRTRLPQFARHPDGTKKGYKQTELGEVPEDWEITTIATRHQLATGNTPPTSDSSNYGEHYLFVSPVDLGGHKYIGDTDKKLSRKGFMLARRFPAGSTLFACIGSTIGKTGIAQIDLTSNQQINAVFPNDVDDEEFIYYVLDYIAPKVKILAGEQAVPIVNKTEFGGTKYTSPTSKKEQTAIATILSDMDEEIQTLQQRHNKFRQIKQGMMQELLTGKTRLATGRETSYADK
ncbi:MAG: restriction endonuclease subunit S [Gammaproteobacteria bacterium]|nr:restriction endonuclease subunit S [Gammaproteobacteria bacterium]